MKIIVLLKSFTGEEWLQPCIDSIYNHVHKIVLLTSKISWIGGEGNPSIPVIKTITECYDPEKKIIHINYDEPNQIKHCMHGYRYIQNNFDCDYIQLIDSDELWDKKNYTASLEFIKKNPGYKAYRSEMYTYIKSPFYRIDPPEPLKPVCFIKPDLSDMGLEPRGCSLKPFIIMEDIFCHHFIFVRYHFNGVLEKLIQSHVSEKQPYEDMSKWIPEVWNKLPNCKENFHPAIGYGTSWKRIKQIQYEDLPEVLHNQRYPDILKYGG